MLFGSILIGNPTAWKFGGGRRTKRGIWAVAVGRYVVGKCDGDARGLSGVKISQELQI